MSDKKIVTGQLISDAASRSQLFAAAGQSEQPATKVFAVNATGNLFVASTLNEGNSSVELSAEATKAFGEVSVFFSALTKTMALKGKGVYDYDTLKQVISSSGLFVQVSETDIDFKSSSWGITFGGDLVKAVLGASGGLAGIAKGLMDMISGIGAAASSISISGSSEKEQSRLGTIIFVCEYLMGAVSITPIIVSVSAEKANKAFGAEPCLKASKDLVELDIRKSVYLFVPPSFMEQAGELNKAMQDSDFSQLVDSLATSLPTASE